MIGGKILLTGASSGIGAALARRLAGAHVRLGLVARRRQRLEALREELLPKGAQVSIYEADVRDAAAMRQVADSFVELAGGVSLAIANAGVSRSDALYKGDAEPAADLVAINLQGTLNTLVPLIPHMIAAESGHLAAIGSVAGFRGMPGKGAYCASKGAVVALTRQLALDYASDRITVNAICPGFVQTALARPVMGVSTEHGLTPSGRLGTPDEVAHAALFLASPRSEFLPGTALVVDGGYTAR